MSLPDLSAFQAAVHEKFAAHDLAGRPLPALTLSSVQVQAEDARGQSYSLFFHAGPPLLEQQTVRLAHARLGEFPLFVVPVARTAGGFEYEAVCSFLRSPPGPERPSTSTP